MNRKIVSFTSALIILFSVMSFHKATVEITMGSPTTTISVDPPTSTVVVGQTFMININISDVVDLYGWEFRLRWNSTLLDFVDVTQGPFLKQGGSTYFVSKNYTDYILVDCTLLGDVSGVSGDGILATVEFYVEGEGESVLDLYDTILISSDEQSIPHQSTDGYGYFIPAHDVAVISVIASPTTAPIGQPIYINVTVENQGASTESFNVAAYYNSNVIETQSVSNLISGASKTLTFTWDTTGVNKGDYTISAEASVVSGETDTTDNTKVADSMVTLLSLGHDVAIKGVTPSKTIVGQGYSLSIHITAKNYGSFTETFNVTGYVNTTILQTQSVTLTSGNSTTITFLWNTTGFAKGNYTISANATIVPGETDTADNTYTDGTVRVNMPGDIAPEFGIVDIVDVVTAAIAFGSERGDLNYNPNADINCDGLIDIVDIVIIAIHFGENDP